MAYSLRFRRRRFALRRRSYFAYARLRRYARRRRFVSYKGRKFGWVTLRRNKSRRTLRRYSFARRQIGVEVNYIDMNAPLTWNETNTRGYSPFFPNLLGQEGTPFDHKIRCVYLEFHWPINVGYSTRIFILHIRNWSSTEANYLNPFAYWDSPISRASPQTPSTQVLPIPFSGFYDTGNSGNIRVIYDRVFDPPPTGQGTARRYLRFVVGRGYDISFTDEDVAYGQNRWVLAIMINGPNLADPTIGSPSVRLAYTNVQ